MSGSLVIGDFAVHAPPEARPRLPTAPEPASLALPSVVSKCRSLAQASLKPVASSGAPPSRSAKASRAEYTRAAFFEQTGVVLLGTQAPDPSDLKERFVPALDRFLISQAINIHARVDTEDDPRRARFLDEVRRVRTWFEAEVETTTYMCGQFSDALRTQLEQQGAVRVVSPDEHAVKLLALHDKFATVLSSLLAQTRTVITKLHKAFMSPYVDAPLEKAVRLEAPVVYGDAMFATERALATGGSRRSGGGRVRGSTVRPPEERRQMRAQWKALWESTQEGDEEEEQMLLQQEARRKAIAAQQAAAKQERLQMKQHQQQQQQQQQHQQQQQVHGDPSSTRRRRRQRGPLMDDDHSSGEHAASSSSSSEEVSADAATFPVPTMMMQGSVTIPSHWSSAPGQRATTKKARIKLEPSSCALPAPSMHPLHSAPPPLFDLAAELFCANTAPMPSTVCPRPPPMSMPFDFVI